MNGSCAPKMQYSVILNYVIMSIHVDRTGKNKRGNWVNVYKLNRHLKDTLYYMPLSLCLHLFTVYLLFVFYLAPNTVMGLFIWTAYCWQVLKQCTVEKLRGHWSALFKRDSEGSGSTKTDHKHVRSDALLRHWAPGQRPTREQLGVFLPVLTFLSRHRQNIAIFVFLMASSY